MLETLSPTPATGTAPLTTSERIAAILPWLEEQQHLTTGVSVDVSGSSVTVYLHTTNMVHAHQLRRVVPWTTDPDEFKTRGGGSKQWCSAGGRAFGGYVAVICTVPVTA